MRKAIELTENQLQMHLQIMAHSTLAQLDMMTRLLRGERDPDAILEVLEMLIGTHLLAGRMDDEDIERTLITFTSNVQSFIECLRSAAAADDARHKAVNDND